MPHFHGRAIRVGTWVRSEANIPCCVDKFTGSSLFDELFGSDNVTVEYADEIGIYVNLEVFLCAIKQRCNFCYTSVGHHNIEV